MNAMNERRDFLRSFSFLRPRHNAVQKGDGRGRSRRCLRHIKGGNSALFLLRSIGTLRWNRCPRKYPQQTPLGAQNRAQGEKEEQQSQCGFIRFYFPLPFSLIKKNKRKRTPKTVMKDARFWHLLKTHRRRKAIDSSKPCREIKRQNDEAVNQPQPAAGFSHLL